MNGFYEMHPYMNAVIHQWTAALATGAVLHSAEVERGEATAWPLAGGGLAALLTKLPDVLEPPVHPHHASSFTA
jgi:inner membrane protein